MWWREELSADGPQTLHIAPSYLEANQNIMVIHWTCKIRIESSFKPQAFISCKEQDPVTQSGSEVSTPTKSEVWAAYNDV